jgi:hypothetical protein
VSLGSDGRNADLKGLICNLSDDTTPDQYIKTTKEILTFVARNYYSCTSDVMEGLQQLKLDDPQATTDPDPKKSSRARTVKDCPTKT